MEASFIGNLNLLALRRYEKGRDTELSIHYDNSEVTLNICLGDKFTGGDLVLYGNKNSLLPSKSVLIIEHKVGYATLHLGSVLHRALPIVSGMRSNLVVWCRSAIFRAKNGCSMCGSKERLGATQLPEEAHGKWQAVQQKQKGCSDSKRPVEASRAAKGRS